MFSISHTTRCAHMEEVHGRDYNFVSLEQFETDIKMVGLRSVLF